MMSLNCDDALVERIAQLYDKISRLRSLRPSKNVDAIFSELVSACSQPSLIDVRCLTAEQQEMRTRLIRLCGEAETHLEFHFAAKLGRFPAPLDRLHAFPYYGNYLKLARLEFETLREHAAMPKRVAFVGSGPLPLTSIVLALHHLPFARLDNYDLDPDANALARLLVAGHADLAARMAFVDADVMEVTGPAIAQYDLVVLAALVGMHRPQKLRVVRHLRLHMAPGAVLLLRSAHGARAFLYPVIDLDDLRGFDVLAVVHPTDEVINSVIVARKRFDE